VHILVLADRDWTHPQGGGTGTNLFGHVSRWLAWGHRVSVIGASYEGGASVERHGDLTMHRLGGRSTVFPRTIWKQWRGLVPDADVVLEVINGITFLTPLWMSGVRNVIPTLSGSRIRHVSDMGFPQIGYQTFKLLAHQRLHEAVSHWREKYPGVDIVLIEPDPNDELMFATNIMNYAKRIEIARHGFESVTIKLAKDYDSFRSVCARHGIEISATRVRRVIKRFAQEREKTRAWRRILEQTTGALLRQSEEG